MESSTIGIIYIVLLAVACFKLSLKKYMLIVFIISTMSATGVLYIKGVDYSVTLPQIGVGLLILKSYIKIKEGKISLNKIKLNLFLKIFIGVISISLLYPLIFSKGVVVLNPDNKYEPIIFNFQIITQYLYLILAIVTLKCVIYICKKYDLTYEELANTCKWVCVLFFIMLILQKVLPVEIYNYIFRGSKLINNQTISGQVRLTGPTIEASMLSYTIIPFLSIVIYDSIKNSKIVFIVLSFLNIFLISTTKSSTFLVAITIMIIILFLYSINQIVKKQQIKYKTLILIIIGIIIFILLIPTLKNILNDVIKVFIEKLSGESISGVQRTSAFEKSIDVFKRYPITGVGFGTVRSYDLFSTWVCSIGILGLTPFFMYIISVFKGIFKSDEGKCMFMYLSILLITMFTSVPEPYYLFIWIGFGFAEYFKYKHKIKGS